jgi:hypothetical protein
MKSLKQGKVVVEPANDDDELLVMFPDGAVELVDSSERAYQLAQQWFRRHLPRRGLLLGLGEIEWRRCQPPRR